MLFYSCRNRKLIYLLQPPYARKSIIYNGRFHFIREPMLILDFCIVAVSIALEVVFEDEPEGGLLIIARMW